MKTWRLQHPTKETFFEVFWDGLEVELVSGKIGMKGRARRTEHASVGDAERFITAELGKRAKQGFEEVVPEALPVELARTAPVAPAAPALLSEILAHPADDAPRLVYADYLLGHADPLGELIVVQCERARLDRWDPRYHLLAGREETLLMTFRRRWLGPIADRVTATFVRGFVDKIRFDGGDARERVLDRAFEIAPLLGTLDIPGHFARQRLGTDAALARLAGLVIHGPLMAETVGHWMLPGLVRFAVKNGGIGPEPLRQLATRAWRELGLENYALGINGMRLVLDRLDPSVIEVLDLGSSGATDGGAGKLAKVGLPRLRALGLRRSSLTGRGLEALAAAGDLRSLARLDLSSNPEAGPGLPALASSHALPALHELDLHAVPLDADDVSALARSRLADRLVVLDLGGCGIDEAGAESIADGAWPRLAVLNLGGNAVGGAGDRLRQRFPNIHLNLRV